MCQLSKYGLAARKCEVGAGFDSPAAHLMKCGITIKMQRTPNGDRTEYGDWSTEPIELLTEQEISRIERIFNGAVVRR